MEIIKNKRNILLVLLLFVSIIVIITRFISTDNENNPIKKDTKISNVSSYSKFFTLDECANKYIKYLQKQDKDSLIKLLSTNYQQENNISINNVLDKLDNLTDSEYSFQSKMIKQEKLSHKKTKYYVYGLLKKDIINNNDLGRDYYLIITVNEKNNLFEVTPYNGKIFKEVK